MYLEHIIEGFIIDACGSRDERKLDGKRLAGEWRGGEVIVFYHDLPDIAGVDERARQQCRDTLGVT